MITQLLSTDITLENERVILRPLQYTDIENLLGPATSSADIWDYSPVSGQTNAQLIKYIEHAIQGRREGSAYPFIIFDKQTGTYAGSTRIYEIDFNKGSLTVGYTWIGKGFQGTGLNKQCKLLLFDYAFETLKMKRIELRADSRNAQSILAMKGIGCTHEGTLRSTFNTPSGRRDSAIFSMLDEEWKNEKRDLLSRKIELLISL